MLNAMSGALRVLAQTRSNGPGAATGSAAPATARQVALRAIRAARLLADALTATPRTRRRALAGVQSRVREQGPARSVAARRRLYRRNYILRVAADRALPVVIAAVVLVAAGVSLAPDAARVGAAEGGASVDAGSGMDFQTVRLRVGGAVWPAEFDGPVVEEPAGTLATPIDDGTLYKPVAVDTSVKSSAGMLKHYTVQGGDTLTGIASRFGVSMMTVWWANRLTTKESIKEGMDLVIPPVDGLVVTVTPGDTLNSLATDNGITVEAIVATNELDDLNLVIGQVLVLPGAKGKPIPTPEPKTRDLGGEGSSASPRPNGAWAWPVIGGGNYISQYFHYGHYGIDIAASYGTWEVAPRPGRVVFAGWKSNGGGYQVWIDLGGGRYVAMAHMSSVAVATGDNVSKGTRVGRIGSSGWATGNHVHFEAWVGYPWKSGSYRVNALRYY